MVCGWCGFVGVVILLRLRLFYVVAICWDFWVFAWCGVCGFDLFQADGLGWLGGCAVILV